MFKLITQTRRHTRSQFLNYAILLLGGDINHLPNTCRLDGHINNKAMIIWFLAVSGLFQFNCDTRPRRFRRRSVFLLADRMRLFVFKLFCWFSCCHSVNDVHWKAQLMCVFVWACARVRACVRACLCARTPLFPFKTKNLDGCLCYTTLSLFCHQLIGWNYVLLVFISSWLRRPRLIQKLRMTS